MLLVVTSEMIIGVVLLLVLVLLIGQKQVGTASGRAKFIMRIVTILGLLLLATLLF